jgi:hypothetical protein
MKQSGLSSLERAMSFFEQGGRRAMLLLGISAALLSGQTGAQEKKSSPGDQTEKSCSSTAGSARARRMVKQCLQVSPATHPPCNAQNSCDLIIDEIKRGCALLDAKERPAFCARYK